VLWKRLHERPKNWYNSDHIRQIVVHALKEHDPVARIHFCNWFLPAVHDGEVDPVIHFCTTCSYIDIINPMLCSKNVFVCFAWFSEKRTSIFLNSLCNRNVMCFPWGTQWTSKYYIGETYRLQRNNSIQVWHFFLTRWNTFPKYK